MVKYLILLQQFHIFLPKRYLKKVNFLIHHINFVIFPLFLALFIVSKKVLALKSHGVSTYA